MKSDDCNSAVCLTVLSFWKILFNNTSIWTKGKQLKNSDSWEWQSYLRESFWKTWVIFETYFGVILFIHWNRRHLWSGLILSNDADWPLIFDCNLLSHSQNTSTPLYGEKLQHEIFICKMHHISAYITIYLQYNIFIPLQHAAMLQYITFNLI